MVHTLCLHSQFHRWSVIRAAIQAWIGQLDTKDTGLIASLSGNCGVQRIQLKDGVCIVCQAELRVDAPVCDAMDYDARGRECAERDDLVLGQCAGTAPHAAATTAAADLGGSS